MSAPESYPYDDAEALPPGWRVPLPAHDWRDAEGNADWEAHASEAMSNIDALVERYRNTLLKSCHFDPAKYPLPYPIPLSSYTSVWADEDFIGTMIVRPKGDPSEYHVNVTDEGIDVKTVGPESCVECGTTERETRPYGSDGAYVCQQCHWAYICPCAECRRNKLRNDARHCPRHGNDCHDTEDDLGNYCDFDWEAVEAAEAADEVAALGSCATCDGGGCGDCR